jgi:hypothetical protein
MVLLHTLNTGLVIGGCGGGSADPYRSAVDPTLLGALIGGGAAVVGGGVTGLIPYWVGRKEWVRDRAAQHMEEFYVIASRHIETLRRNPLEQDPNVLEKLRNHCRLLKLYAPQEVWQRASHLNELLLEFYAWKDEWTDQVKYEKKGRILGVLAQYQYSMAACLGIAEREGIASKLRRRRYIAAQWISRKRSKIGQ